VPPGGGGSNVRMYAVAPDGRTLSQMGGYWPPEHLAPFFDLSRPRERTIAQLRERLAGERDPERRAVLERLSAQYATETPWHVRDAVSALARSFQLRGC